MNGLYGKVIRTHYVLLTILLINLLYIGSADVLITHTTNGLVVGAALVGEGLLLLILAFLIIRSLVEPLKKFKQLTDALEAVAQAHDAGDIDARIAPEALDAGYRRPAVKINQMVEGHISVKKKAMAVVAQFAKGNFDAPLEKFPGKKAFINENIEDLRTDLKSVHAEISQLITSFKNGELSARADAGKFSGEWAALISELNDLLEITLAPIRESESVLEKMEQGDLSTHVTGNYKGDHALIKNSLNHTIDQLSVQIKEISHTLIEMSEGNLDVGINGEYNGDFTQLKTSLNYIISSFNTLLRDIENSADQVASGAKQVSDSAQALASGATEQASAVEELTASIEEISTQITKNAEHAGNADGLAQSAKQNALDGNSQMSKMLQSMDEINESSSNISKIIKVIDEIAFQTNILALNAAVEAARAGQHGKGFAVVAEEVRNLAARSASAAKETTALIEGSIKKVEAGTQIANDTAAELNKIVEAVTKIATFTNEIANASKEQASGIEQINQGINQVSQVVQTNSATSEESASASEELSSHADMLKKLVRKFKLKEERSITAEAKEISPAVLQMIDTLAAKPKARQEAAVGVAGNISDSDFGKY